MATPAPTPTPTATRTPRDECDPTPCDDMVGEIGECAEAGGTFDYGAGECVSPTPAPSGTPAPSTAPTEAPAATTPAPGRSEAPSPTHTPPVADAVPSVVEPAADPVPTLPYTGHDATLQVVGLAMILCAVLLATALVRARA